MVNQICIDSGIPLDLISWEGALGRIYRSAVRRPITTLTLFGGLASTVYWPLSAWLVGAVGWRGICLIYAAIQIGFSHPMLLLGLPKESKVR